MASERFLRGLVYFFIVGGSRTTTFVPAKRLLAVNEVSEKDDISKFFESGGLFLRSVMPPYDESSEFTDWDRAGHWETHLSASFQSPPFKNMKTFTGGVGIIFGGTNIVRDGCGRDRNSKTTYKDRKTAALDGRSLEDLGPPTNTSKEKYYDRVNKMLATELLEPIHGSHSFRNHAFFETRLGASADSQTKSIYCATQEDVLQAVAQEISEHHNEIVVAITHENVKGFWAKDNGLLDDINVLKAIALRNSFVKNFPSHENASLPIVHFLDSGEVHFLGTNFESEIAERSEDD